MSLDAMCSDFEGELLTTAPSCVDSHVVGSIPKSAAFHGVGGHGDEVQGHASSPSAVVTSARAEALVQTVENIIVVLSFRSSRPAPISMNATPSLAVVGRHDGFEVAP